MNIPSADIEYDFDVKCSKSYLICAAPRSGSTLLACMLMDTNLAGLPFEFIHESSMGAFFSRVGRPMALDEYINFLKERRCSQNGVFGIKAQYEQLYWNSMDTDVQLKFIKCFDYFILIYRRDLLSQAISYYRAALTGVWHEPVETSPATAGSDILDQFDAAQISEHLASLFRQPESWRRLLRDAEAEWLEVAYEDLVQNPAESLRRVMAHLELEVDALPSTPSPKLRRQSDAINRAWKARYVSALLGEPAGVLTR